MTEAFNRFPPMTVPPFTLVAYRHENEVAVSTLQLLEKLDALKDRQAAKAFLLDNFLRAHLNDELELLATHAIEMTVKFDDPRIVAAKRLSPDHCVMHVTSLMRKIFAKLCRDHQKDEA